LAVLKFVKIRKKIEFSNCASTPAPPLEFVSYLLLEDLVYYGELFLLLEHNLQFITYADFFPDLTRKIHPSPL